MDDLLSEEEIDTIWHLFQEYKEGCAFERAEFLETLKVIFPKMISRIRKYRELQVYLVKYARHSELCAKSSSCLCGLDEVFNSY